MKNPYLVIIDVQEKLFPIVHEKETFLKNLQILIKGFQLFNLPILLTEQVPDKLGFTIEPIMSLLPDLKPISKSSFSCAGDVGFTRQAGSYSNCDGVVLAGIETHVCVYQTERDLIHRGQHVEVVTDAVTSRDPNNHGIALDRIRNNGGFLTTVEMLLFSLQEKAEGERFRELIKLVK
ncbi:isochorismatase family protein [Candidatus Marinimicrobia bacterium]|jgi:nicotinamidase-related amidase|nr:isochorismatase family protein [Candidatus Neomarinimicrobiota bacterium]MDC0480274.1 isochorismatase family protein [Candidatus Neomarinimicrobiota bacterium]MDC1037792.1 isochorismatase family protein [Candidatus Neomarinimicrobiota bacterium]